MRTFARADLWLMVVWILLGARVDAAQPDESPRRLPNVLFIFADDQCYETIHALGNQHIETPNLDQLARSGVTFTHAYNMGAWHGAVCVASRTMLNTGRFVWRARSIENHLLEQAADGKLWSQVMSRAGYQTYMSGKWHVKIDPQKIFDHVKHVRPGMPQQTEAGYLRPQPGKPDPWQAWNPKFGGFWKGGKHWSEVLADDARSFLQQAAESNAPFFAYLAFNAPHDPRQSPREFLDRYPVEQMPVPENFLPDYPYKESIGAGVNLRDERLAPWPRTKHAIQVHRREYYALITHMDEQIGKIIEALRQTGQADNTIIIFTADHGLAVGHHGLMGKQNMYEHSLRPPLIITGPGMPHDRRIDVPVYLQDVMPTAIELAHAPIPDHIEFRSLLPLIHGDRDRQYPAIYGAYRDDQQRTIIVDDFKLIHYPQIPKYLLFNLAKDPGEMTDLADLPAYADQQAALIQHLDKLERKMDDPLTK